MKKEIYEQIRNKLKLIKDELPCRDFDMSEENLCSLNLDETYTDTFAFTKDEKLKVTTSHRVDLDSYYMVPVKKIINSMNEENEGRLMLDDMFGKYIVFEQAFDFEYVPSTVDLLHIIAEQLSVINEFMTKLYEFYTNHLYDGDVSCHIVI